MDAMRLGELLDAIGRVRIAVVGDFCLDAYWLVDSAGSEVSLETGKATRAVRRQRYGLGGAGNVVANLVDLGVAGVEAVAVVGDDLFGREMVRMLGELGVGTDGMVVQAEEWDTPVYGKPYEDHVEGRRIDFGGFNALSAASVDVLTTRLSEIVSSVDAVIVNQQLAHGLWTEAMIERMNALVREASGELFVLDSRDRADRFEGMVLKVNAVEAARMCGRVYGPGDLIVAEEAQELAVALTRRTGRPVFVTRGDRGMIVAGGGDGGGESVHVEPGLLVMGQTDPVGAGDTTVSALAGALAAGAGMAEAAAVANAAATVTVQKLLQTGTASPAEILVVGGDPDYVYNPELADDARRARRVADTEIELIGQPEGRFGRIAHAVFDHDGTISVLRQGWEAVMQPMMVRAILGEAYKTADEGEYQRVVGAVSQYIDRSTGVQTIVQMKALVEMVRQFGYVPEGEIVDAAGYKAIYNEALMGVVRRRLEKLERGELTVEDVTVVGAVRMLTLLRERGVRLYLASGTDREDVVAEATALGYADWFEGRIYGAVGDVSKYSKKMVVEEILREHGLSGAELACFGDGPVELREARKHGGVAVGVASDEVRRWSLDGAKRSRLIKAGADVVVPDFSQADRLMAVLWSS